MTGPHNAVRGDLAEFELDRDSIRLLSEAFCRRNEVAILGRFDPTYDHPVHLGILNPQKTTLITDVSSQLNRQVVPVQLNRYEIERVINHGFSVDEDVGHYLLVQPVPPSADSSPRDLLDALLWQAVAHGVSDIHIENYDNNVDVRVRRDGILHEMFSHMHPGNSKEVVNRLKVISKLQISEHRRPQDGRFRVHVAEGEDRVPVDFRVSIIPGPAGEDAVIRILDSRVGLVDLADLGMTAEMQTLLLQLLANPEGLILVTGPTGCGKTSTLYSALEHVRDGTRKVVTAEDPIEYYLDQVNQKQVTSVMGYPDLLRALLRHDPDVMLFGEIRDEETAQIAVRAANTGHLVLATLHSSDAIGAIERLRGLGLGDFDIASVVLCVVSQRLVRKVCTNCTQPTIPLERHSVLMGDLLQGLKFVEGGGCDSCAGTGYNGRTGIFEMLLIDEGLQDRIATAAPRSKLKGYLRVIEFHTLVEHGLEKVGKGITTVSEIARVIPYRQLSQEAKEAYQAHFEQ